MNIREVKQHLENEKKKRGQQHLQNVLGRSRGELIQPFTDKQWDKIRTRQKSSFSKGKTAAYTSVWNHNQVKIA
jgi:hypothetical protein